MQLSQSLKDVAVFLVVVVTLVPTLALKVFRVVETLVLILILIFSWF